MSNRKALQSTKQYQSGSNLEKSGDENGAIKLYQKATTTDPANVRAWNRLMILFRKGKTKQEEIELITTAIAKFKKLNEVTRQQWLKENREKADHTRELAKVLGLLEENGMPAADNDILEKWQTRLYLLEYRLKNTRKKTKRITVQSSARKKTLPKPRPVRQKLNSKAT